MASQRGFTLIELMVTVTVAAILISVAIPFFRDVIISSRLNTVSLEIADALALARSESIKRNRTITFCTTDTATNFQCTGGTSWKFWLVKQNANSTKEEDVIQQGGIGSLNSQITVTTQNINKNILNFSTDGLVRNNGALLNEAEIILQADDLSKNAKRILSLSAVGQIAIKKDDKNSTEANK